MNQFEHILSDEYLQGYSNTVTNLLAVGAHLGGFMNKWKPYMSPYIYGVQKRQCIFDLTKTVDAIEKARENIKEVVAGGGKVLFVCTSKRLQDFVAAAVSKAGQFYVNRRWLGGTLTNWQTISGSIKKLEKIRSLLSMLSDSKLEKGDGKNEKAGANKGGNEVFKKKEELKLRRQQEKLTNLFGGIEHMGGLPDLVVLIDSQSQQNAFNECRSLSIPLCAVVDTNGKPGRPDEIDFLIPSNNVNDRASELILHLLCSAALDGKIMKEKADLDLAASRGVGGVGNNAEGRQQRRGYNNNNNKNNNKNNNNLRDNMRPVNRSRSEVRSSKELSRAQEENS